MSEAKPEGSTQSSSLGAGPPPSNASPTGFFGRIGALLKRFSLAVNVTAITAIVSAVIPLTEAIRGYSAQKLKEEETHAALEQKKLDQTATLATDYLGRLTSPNLKPDDRLMYLSALAQLTGHPLQDWAREQRKKQDAVISELAALATKIQQAIDKAPVAQTELVQLRAEIDIVSLTLSQSKSPAELETYRKALSELNRRRDVLQASDNLLGLIGEYKTLVENANPGTWATVFKDSAEKLKQLSAQARSLSRAPIDHQTKVTALRLAAVTAWDADDALTAEDAANEAVQLCQANAKSLISDRDCTLIAFAQILSAFRVFKTLRDNGKTGAAFPYADRILRAALPLRQELTPLPPGKLPKGIESANGHVRKVISVVGCWVHDMRTDGQLRGQADRLYVSQGALLTAIDLKPEETCHNLPDMNNTIWP